MVSISYEQSIALPVSEFPELVLIAAVIFRGICLVKDQSNTLYTTHKQRSHCGLCYVLLGTFSKQYNVDELQFLLTKSFPDKFRT